MFGPNAPQLIAVPSLSSLFPSLQPAIWMSISSVSWTCPACVGLITPKGGAACTWSVRSAGISCRSQVGFVSRRLVRVCLCALPVVSVGSQLFCLTSVNPDQFLHLALFVNKPPNSTRHTFTPYPPAAINLDLICWPSLSLTAHDAVHPNVNSVACLVSSSYPYSARATPPLVHGSIEPLLLNILL